MDIKSLVSELSHTDWLGWGTGAIILFLSLIQISPLKLNPWDRILGWVGKRINGKLKQQVTDLWINSHRQTLLTFARECRAEMEHSADEWSYVLNVAEEYEAYCEKNDIRNGIVKAETMYIQNLYQDLCRQNKVH